MKEGLGKKFGLCKGFCCMRFSCKNVNKDYCKPYPKGKEDFIKCKHFEMDDEKT